MGRGCRGFPGQKIGAVDAVARFPPAPFPRSALSTVSVVAADYSSGKITEVDSTKVTIGEAKVLLEVRSILRCDNRPNGPMANEAGKVCNGTVV